VAEAIRSESGRFPAADVLPRSVYDRVKSPYPSTQDPAYAVALQNNLKGLLTDSAHPVFEIVSRDWLKRALRIDTPQITQASRRGLERTLDLALWMDMYRPTLKLA
jgi:asparagine synthase (glutamine-hydrolysing)